MNICKFVFTKDDKNKKDDEIIIQIKYYVYVTLTFCNNKNIKDTTVYIKHTFANYC